MQKIFLAYVLIGFFSFNADCQNIKLADSLINEVNSGRLSDSVKCILYNKIAFNSSSPDQTIHYSELGLELSEKINLQKQIALSYLYLGDGHRLKGDLTKAIESYLKSAEKYSSLEEVIGESTAYSNLGNVYLAEGNYENSKIYFHKAIEIFRKEKDSTRLATTLLNTGELYREYHILDSALIYFQRSKVIFKNLNYPIGTAYNLGNIGLVLAEKGADNQAEENMNQAIAILEELGDRYPIAVYQNSLADIYAKRGEYNKAVKYARSSLNIGVEEGLKEQIRDASLKLSELYKSAKSSDQAYIYLKQYITYRDSINSEETIRKMADLRTEYEVNKKQVEVDLLSKQAKLNRIIAWSAVFIIALLLVLTVALLKIYRIKDRAVRIVRQRRRVIAAQRNKLDEVNKTKDRFFSIISHDIRGPISNFQGISGLINVLADSNDVDGLRQLGSMMEASAKEVSELLDNLLEWALSQEGRIPYYPQEVSLRETCQSNLNIMLNLAIAKNIDLIGHLPNDVILLVDKNSVSTIIRNLLSNAIKFTPEQGNVMLSIAEEDGFGIIEVKDSGIGISNEKLENLFSLKGTRSQWGTKGEKGIGLGLLLVHEFVELNNGRIEVESEEGKGTVFKVYLPLNSKTNSSDI
ncbi:Signal transduction histidine kinase [Reichenbachiella faecimaris]|uniref:histidine kinase n=1 Tax=Reichenbachiella faecimaris TaxID=692418 RepID=A0A1W2GCW8_REIFA|nr:tetratricopeptide repeat-containing sensor histidine kinase [Reichenbachiella faecimaris]SMD34188.1 Signal transduction histidine kinase [Reichenbachiella faecimaris]